MDILKKFRPPDKPGVYLMKRKGDVLYVGKAKSLSKRISSYFSKSRQTDKIASMLGQVDAVEYILTESETEAMLLESNLIKRYSPKYNIVLKDDKRYPYILITREEFPRVLLTRSAKGEGDYYGPYPHAEYARRMVKFIKKIFGLRDCRIMKKKACLSYHIGLCSAPCEGRISGKEYAERVKGAVMLFEKKNVEIVKKLKEMMEDYAEKLEFEKAGMTRDVICAVENAAERQRVNLFGTGSIQVIGIRTSYETACISVLSYGEGNLVEKTPFFIEGIGGESEEDILEAFVKQYYLTKPAADRIIVPCGLRDAAIKRALEKKWGKRIRIAPPAAEDERAMLDMAKENAEFDLNQKIGFEESIGKGLIELKDMLGLCRVPDRIEGFDISNIMGTDACGSMVVFVKGRPKKEEYRRFKIKTVDRIDDPGMIREVVFRRYFRLAKEKKRLPDLVLIDGGITQLNAASSALARAGASVPVISIAKKEEKIYMRNKEKPLALEKHSKALRILQSVRDESHRFAVSYHRTLRRKSRAI